MQSLTLAAVLCMASSPANTVRIPVFGAFCHVQLIFHWDENWTGKSRISFVYKWHLSLRERKNAKYSMLLCTWRDRSFQTQGCCLTGARSPGAPKFYMRATKFLYKEPARAPMNLRLSWDNGPYVPINLDLLAELQTMELFMCLARSHTW